MSASTLTPAQYHSEALYWYRQQLAKATEKITLLGLPTMWMDLARTDDPLLRQLFVTPAVGPSVREPESDEPDATDALHPLDALRKHRRIVLLGAPGSGKSTLAQWLVWYACQQSSEAPEWFRPLVPVHITLRDMDLAECESFDDLLERHARVRSAAPKAYAEVRDAVNAAIKAGQALIIVDGYDEVSAAHLPGVQALLRDALGQDSGNCWLLTSRPLGYDAAPLQDVRKAVRRRLSRMTLPLQNTEVEVEAASAKIEASVTHPIVLHLQPFDDRRIQSFAEAWYRLMTGGPEDGLRLTDHFEKAVNRSADTRTLARTPNLLALMVLLFRQRQTLPDGRAELYGLIAEAYLESIDAARFGRNRGHVGDAVPLKVKRQWLARLGFEMQRLRADSSEPGSVVFERKQVLSWLEQGIAATHPELATEEFTSLYLRWLQARTGLMIERGEGRFSFVHLSFQEYFCGLYLAAEFSHRDFGRCNTPEAANEQGMDPRVNPVTLWRWASRPAWQEVYVFAAEQLASLGPNVRAWLESFLGRSFRWLRDGRIGRNDERASLSVRLLLNPHAGCERFALSLFEALLAWVDASENHEKSFFVDVRATALTRLLSAERWQAAVWAHWQNCSHLDLSQIDLQDLRPLAGLRALQSLALSGKGVTDLRPLAGLGALQSLSFDGTDVTDLRPLAELGVLHSLSLNGSGVTDLHPLAGLSALQSLSLNGTSVTDLSPLAALSALQSLSLNGTGVTDLSPLAGLSGLQSLSILGTGVSDLRPLAGLSGLQSLSFFGVGITDLRPLAGLSGLQSLSLNGADVTDLTPLAELRALQSLSLNSAGVTDLSPLAELSGLQSLSLNGADVTDLTPLAELRALQSLSLNGSGVIDLSPLAELRALQSLTLYGAAVTDLSPLAALSGLQSLLVFGGGVMDLQPLAGLSGLQSLSIVGGDLTDLRPLAGLRSLHSLYLDHADASDLRPLAGLSGLQSLSLRGNSVTDLRPLAELPALQKVFLRPADELALWALHPLVERGVTLR